MIRDRIRAHAGVVPMAMNAALAAPLLSMDWPTGQRTRAAVTVAGGDLRIGPGERFVIVRSVAVLPIRGIITPNFFELEEWLGWSTSAGIEQAADEVRASEDVQAVILDVDSPGGYVTGVNAAADAIALLAAVKPVYAIANPVMCSAAYLLASQATSIAAAPGSLIGSIGVMTERAWPVQPSMAGDQWSVHTSTYARAKYPNPTDERGQAEIQRMLDESEADFHGYVARGRGIDPAALTAQLSVTDDPQDGGAVFGPAEAIRRGLADSAETRSAFFDRVLAAHAPQPRKTGTGAQRARAAAAMAIART